jgi:hypothetical protein
VSPALRKSPGGFVGLGAQGEQCPHPLPTQRVPQAQEVGGAMKADLRGAQGSLGEAAGVLAQGRGELCQPPVEFA